YRGSSARRHTRPGPAPAPELRTGGGGEEASVGLAPRHADHWNVWGGPDALKRKGRILDERCAEAGRDPKSIVHSANMPILITDRREEVDALATAVSRRMGYPESMVRDLLLAGSVSEVRDKLGRLRDAGVGMVFAPSMFFPKDPRQLLDRFMSEVAPACGWGATFCRGAALDQGRPSSARLSWSRWLSSCQAIRVRMSSEVIRPRVAWIPARFHCSGVIVLNVARFSW